MVWFPINQLPGFAECIEYYVNEKGEVISVKTRDKEGRKLKPRVANSGSVGYRLMNRLGDKRARHVSAAQLVALAFLGKPPKEIGKARNCCRIHYKDGNIQNTELENLEYRINGESYAEP